MLFAGPEVLIPLVSRAQKFPKPQKPWPVKLWAPARTASHPLRLECRQMLFLALSPSKEYVCELV